METVVVLGPRALNDRLFCSEVEYQCEGFLEKNRDRVNQELVNVLKRSKVIVYYTSTSDFSPFSLRNPQKHNVSTFSNNKPRKFRECWRTNRKTPACETLPPAV